ncbi:MAG: YrbL family protein [Pseudomonadota bacterium]
MDKPLIHIDSDPIGRGRERVCYLHPQDSRKVIKLCHGDVRKQTNREIDFYHRLQKRRISDLKFVPNYFGTVETNLGSGIVTELISDYNGKISQSVLDVLKDGTAFDSFTDALADLKFHLLENRVIFNNDMYLGNILVRRTDHINFHLVIIDGLGDVVKIQLLNYIASLTRRKIERRWKRFYARALNTAEKAKRL